MTNFRRILNRSPETFLKDFAGAAALMLTLIVALHLPGVY